MISEIQRLSAQSHTNDLTATFEPIKHSSTTLQDKTRQETDPSTPLHASSNDCLILFKQYSNQTLPILNTQTTTNHYSQLSTAKMARAKPMHNTTKKRGHRLPSSSDEEEKGRPRKVSRPAALSSDSEYHLITASQIRERRRVQEDTEGEGEEEDREASEEGPEDAAEDNEEQAEESQSDEDEDDDADEDLDDKSQDDEGLDDYISQEEDDDEYNSDSQPSNTGHRIDAVHIAQLAATILWRLPSDGSQAVTGAEYSYQSNVTFCDNTPAGRLLRFQRWRELVWQETHPGEEGDEESESDSQADSQSDEVPRSGLPSEINPSEPGEVWDGGSWVAWFQWENEWDASWTSQAGRATLEDESLRPPYGDGSRYVLVGAAAEEPIQGRRNDTRRRQGLMGEDEPEEDVESDVPAAEVGGQTDGAADYHEHNVGDEVNGMPWVEYNDTWSGLGQAGDDYVDGRSDGDAENAIGLGSQQAQPPVVPHRTLILTPAGGLPGPPYTGPTTRRRTLENRIRNTPLEPGQGYVVIPIAESQAAQMLLGLYGGEPDGEEAGDENVEDGSGEDGGGVDGEDGEDGSDHDV